MDSLNAPVPGRVAAVADELRPKLAAMDAVRERHALVVKRFAADDDPAGKRRAVRDRLAGAPAVEARVTGVDWFEQPVAGPGPVVYLAVESPGLVAIHRRLCEAFGAVDGLEDDDYVPHVTLARGGDPDAARRVVETEIEPVTWTVSELVFWDARRGVVEGRLSLPG